MYETSLVIDPWFEGAIVPVFGEREDIALWKVAGVFEDNFILDLGACLADLLGMEVEGTYLKTFLNTQGKGGTGIQVYWAWTDSFLVISTWPEIGIIRVAMSTCAIEKFLPVMVTKFLEAVIGPVREYAMPIENGKINWWALSAIIVPVVSLIIGYGLSEIRNSDRELLRTLIKQVSDSQQSHQEEQKQIVSELRKYNEKQDQVIAELKDNYKTLCWAVSMPFEQRKQRFNLSPFQFNGKELR